MPALGSNAKSIPKRSARVSSPARPRAKWITDYHAGNMVFIQRQPQSRYPICAMLCLRANHKVGNVDERELLDQDNQNTFIHMIQSLFPAQEMDAGVMFFIPSRKRLRYEFLMLVL